MPFLAAIPAIVGASIIGGGATIGAGLLAKSGADSASKRQTGIQQQALDLQKTDEAQKTQAITDTKPFLDQFYSGGDVRSTPFYKSMLSAGTEGTSRAYNSARMNLRRSGITSGFGYGSPVAGGADRELTARETSDLAVLPRDTELKAIQPGLQASAIRTGQGGMFNPQSDLGIASGIANNQANTAAQSASAFGGGITSSVASILQSIMKNQRKNTNTGSDGSDDAANQWILQDAGRD